MMERGLVALLMPILCLAAESKSTEDTYYATDLSFYNSFGYIGTLGTIFLGFGYYRKKRKDVCKSHEKTVIEEMMESLGLNELPKEQLLSLTSKFSFSDTTLKLKPKGESEEAQSSNDLSTQEDRSSGSISSASSPEQTERSITSSEDSGDLSRESKSGEEGENFNGDAKTQPLLDKWPRESHLTPFEREQEKLASQSLRTPKEPGFERRPTKVVALVYDEDESSAS